MASQYSGLIAQLKNQITDMEAALAKEVATREQLEEHMKQAFMRGVCALNIEAMNVMKRGAPPGGANPFPVTYPPNTGLTTGFNPALQARTSAPAPIQQPPAPAPASSSTTAANFYQQPPPKGPIVVRASSGQEAAAPSTRPHAIRH